MATFHFQIKHGKVNTGAAHAEYILRQGRYSIGARAEELVRTGENLPAWASCAAKFFDKADIYERRNGRVYTEFEVALPNELTLDPKTVFCH